MTQRRLLCITKDVDLVDRLKNAMHGWEVHCVENCFKAGLAMRSNEYVVGLIIYEPERQKSHCLDVFLRRHSDVYWIGIFRRQDLECADVRDLILNHMFDYHTAPFDIERVAYDVGHANGLALLRQRAIITSNRVTNSPLVGDCKVMVDLRAQIQRVARVSAPVLIWGESGSGKELTAQEIHVRSSRSSGPFVPINCGAIAPDIIHSELFGYERGAFTGALKSKVGLIESANGGTLFLDEIGDLPKELQASLLRFLQEKTICRLGSTRQITVDARVIAASHVKLHRAVSSGAFREDLYYRLAVLLITVPALRERREDLVTLAEHFFSVYADEKPARLKGFSKQAVAAMLDHDWPGNVRELINRIRRAVVMSNGRLIMPEDLHLQDGVSLRSLKGISDARMRSEHRSLSEVLDRSGQNVSRAARDLGVSRTTMYRLLNKHNLRPQT